MEYTYNCRTGRFVFKTLVSYEDITMSVNDANFLSIAYDMKAREMANNGLPFLAERYAFAAKQIYNMIQDALPGFYNTEEVRYDA